RIVLAGYAQQDHPGDYDMAVARVNANGTLDSTFSGDGRQTGTVDVFDFNQDCRANDVAIDSHGRIGLGGSAQARGPDYDFAAARLNANGTLDTSFGFLGTQSVSFGLGRQDMANAMAIDQRGHIVLAGWTQIDGGNFDMAVTRLNFDGSVDTNFGDF